MTPRDDERRKFEASDLQFARDWLQTRYPPLKCIHCGAVQPQGTMCTAMTQCPKNNYDGHVYEFSINTDPDCHAQDLVAFALARAEQAETPRAAQTREELEKEWLAQTEWQDFANWLIHAKLGYIAAAPVEDRPAPTPEQEENRDGPLWPLDV